jgi:UDP:flavonoid glycosyltransferase YjiC (YdhE family)
LCIHSFHDFLNLHVNMKIMISWELGSNYGHLTRYLALARSMQQRGHTILFAVRDTVLAHNVLRPHGLVYIQAPQPARWHDRTDTIRSYADILLYHGLGEAATAVPLFEAWSEIFVSFKPDLLVPDHSPAALLTAQFLKIPTLEIASGFERPPDITPYPDFRPWLPRDSSSIYNEARILNVINKYGKSYFGITSYDDLPTALKANLSLLASFSELDHYPMRQGGRYIGPITSWSNGVVVDWKNNGMPKVLVYLRRFLGLNAVLDFLSCAALDTILICPDLSATEVSQLQGAAVQVFLQPVQLDQVLKLCDLCISHGGLGISSSCMLTATKVLAMPLHIEQLMLAKATTRCGIGLTLKAKDVTFRRLQKMIALLFTEVSFTSHSHILAQKYCAYDSTKVVQRLVYTAERLVYSLTSRL